MRKWNQRARAFLALLLVITVLPTWTTTAFASSFTNLENGITQKGSRLSFYVSPKNGEECAVTLNGETVKPDWKDSTKTAFTLKLTRVGENSVAIRAGKDEKLYTVYYEGAQNGDVIGSATMDVEAPAIGGGYLIVPHAVALREGQNSAQLLVAELEKYGFQYQKTGDMTNAFYLASIQGDQLKSLPQDGSKVPAVLKKLLGDDIRVRDSLDSLGEFDYTSGSGWMYSVNNNFPNVGFSDYYLSDGDVVRVQFTLALGSDLGGGYSVGGTTTDMYSTANKTKLMKAMAEVGYENVPQEIREIALQLDASQSSVDQSVMQLTGKTHQLNKEAQQSDGKTNREKEKSAPKLIELLLEHFLNPFMKTVTVTKAEVK